MFNSELLMAKMKKIILLAAYDSYIVYNDYHLEDWSAPESSCSCYGI